MAKLKLTKAQAGRLGGLAAGRNSKDVLAARAEKGGVAVRTMYGSAYFGFISRLGKRPKGTK